MAKEPVLKTGARKRLWVRIPPPPVFTPLEVCCSGGVAPPPSLTRPAASRASAGLPCTPFFPGARWQAPVAWASSRSSGASRPLFSGPLRSCNRLSSEFGGVIGSRGGYCRASPSSPILCTWQPVLQLRCSCFPIFVCLGRPLFGFRSLGFSISTIRWSSTRSHEHHRLSGAGRSQTAILRLRPCLGRAGNGGLRHRRA